MPELGDTCTILVMPGSQKCQNAASYSPRCRFFGFDGVTPNFAVIAVMDI